MNSVAAFVGWFCLACLSVGVATAAIALAAACIERMTEKYRLEVDRNTRRDIGRSIGASAWWFSESPDTSLALRILAERLVTYGSADSHQWREQWRKAREAPVETDTLFGLRVNVVFNRVYVIEWLDRGYGQWQVFGCRANTSLDGALDSMKRALEESPKHQFRVTPFDAKSARHVVVGGKLSEQEQ